MLHSAWLLKHSVMGVDVFTKLPRWVGMQNFILVKGTKKSKKKTYNMRIQIKVCQPTHTSMDVGVKFTWIWISYVSIF